MRRASRVRPPVGDGPVDPIGVPGRAGTAIDPNHRVARTSIGIEERRNRLMAAIRREAADIIAAGRLDPGVRSFADGR